MRVQGAATCFDCTAPLSEQLEPREWTIEANQSLFQRERKITVCVRCDAVRTAVAKRAVG